MEDKPTNPFSGLGLDKALLRSTGQPASAPVAEPQAPAAQSSASTAKPRTSRAASSQARTPASTEDSDSTSKHASTLASSTAVIQAIRKIVRTPGREVSYVRLTPTEKGELADIVYGLKRRGRKTTETEINRIAVNFMITDYKQNGEQSILAQVLEALQA